MANIRLGSVSLDCADPNSLATFWADPLGSEIEWASDEFAEVKIPNMWIAVVKVEEYQSPTWPESDVAKQIDLDLAVEDLASGVAEATGLGAVRAEFQPAHDRYVVLLDPAGRPFV